MAKRVNYSFGKRQKEIKRQEKRNEKAEKKRLKKEAAEAEALGPGLPEGEVGSEDAPADDARERDADA